MSTPRTVMIGLPSNHSTVPPDSQPLLAKALAGVATQIADAGIEYGHIAVAPEEGLAALGPQLQAQRPDVVIIGNGIRREMDLTPWMEQIIDIVRTSVPQAKIGFNTKPHDTLDAVNRVFPTAAAAVKSA